MIKPSLSDFSDFVEKPKPVIPKTKYEIQSQLNTYMNIGLFLVILIGFYYLYRRYITKKQHETETKEKLKQFDSYIQDYLINDMLSTQNKYNTY